MPETIADVSVKKVANLIRSMNRQEIETLYLLLTKDGEELLQRKNDVEQKKVKMVTRAEVFNV